MRELTNAIGLTVEFIENLIKKQNINLSILETDFDVFADWYYDSDSMTEKTFVQEINGSVQ